MITIVILSVGKGTFAEKVQMLIIAIGIDACYIVPNLF